MPETVDLEKLARKVSLLRASAAAAKSAAEDALRQADELEVLISRAPTGGRDDDVIEEVVEWLRAIPSCGSLAKYHDHLVDRIEREFDR